MEAKLIKSDIQYRLHNEEGIVIATSLENGKLSIKNCEAIKNGYDLDELAEKEYPTIGKRIKSIPTHNQEGFKAGFQKALEILGDKKFSEKDVKLAINIAWDDDNLSTIDIIQELQQTKWEVEIVEEDSKVVEKHIWDGSNDGELTWKKQPLFDADGCLILRKI